MNGQVLAVDGGFDAAGIGLPTLRKGASLNAASDQKAIVIEGKADVAKVVDEIKEATELVVNIEQASQFAT